MDTFDRWLQGGGPVKRAIRLLVDAAQAWIGDRVTRLGAAVAYYSLFAVIPVLLMAVGLASIFFDQERVRGEVEDLITDLLGSELAEVITQIFVRYQLDSDGGFVALVSVGVLLFSATLLFVAWKDVVDIIWDQPRIRGARGTIRRRLFGVLAVFGAGALLTLNLLAESMVGLLSQLTKSWLADLMLALTGSLLPMALGALFIGILYKYTPEVEIPWRNVWFASVVAMLLLALGAWGYGIYLGAVGFRSASGVAGSAFLGLALVYYASMILLYGVEIVKVKQIGTRAV